MIYRLPCGKALSVRKSLRAVRTVGRNRYIENTPLGSPSGTALRLESTLYSVERLFPLLGGVSRGSVRVGVKTFLLPFYSFSFGYKRKGVNIKECKRYGWSPIHPFSLFAPKEQKASSPYTGEPRNALQPLAATLNRAKVGSGSPRKKTHFIFIVKSGAGC